jgi:hypothetical protein
MPATKRTWAEKLADSKDLPKTVELEGLAAEKWGRGTMVIPAPLEVDAMMRRVPKRKLITIDRVRAELARTHGVQVACPLTTGIFSWIAAHAADEAERSGKKRITPYWRTLKAGGELNPKYPGGLENVIARLEGEGHRVVQRGRRFFVDAYENSLFDIPSA